ncbi:putative C27B12.07-like protein [Cladobotryum mycophilum]|uniref:C27B12.07-like protein n=1 Tax=Cladobotryum mycophilum TaxID=491253 RepID=A0ABR0SE92_9HYPO
MVAGRLTFLYPHLLRAATARGSSIPSWTGVVEPGAIRGWRRTNSSFPKRAGKAVEPLEWEKQQQKDQEQETPAQGVDEKGPEGASKSEIGKQYFRNLENENANENENKKAKPEEVPKEMTEAQAATTNIQEMKANEDEETKTQETAHIEPEIVPIQSSQAETESPAGSSSSKKDGVVADGQPEQAKDGAKPGGLETVILMGAPESIPGQAPVMSSQRYIHHFDSYSLVKQLQEGGYTNEQAITAMKAIRGLLAHNLDMAQERLVSKSDVENESYLFSAACSELSAEIKNNRRIQDEEMRQQRTHLQHEVDILTQSLNQELLTLTDNTRGLFNDRKMAVREEQKTADSAIQQINYKMSIMLSSDSKSEIEGVRWILIRRSVVGIIFMAILTLGTIRYATYVSHESQKEADRTRRREEEVRRDGGKTDHTSAPDAAAILAAN